MAKVLIDNVSVIFGNNTQQALELAHNGASRSEIKEKTGAVLGVHNCNLEIGEGETLVLMGLSGSGKSTLLRTINRLIRIAEGKIFVHSKDQELEISGASFEQMRNLRTHIVAMVFQQFGLLPWRSVADNVGFGLEVAGLNKKQRQKTVEEQLALVGLSEWGNRLISELSGGMQQRIGLARAFATGAPILLMDEPFSALDPLIRNYLQDELIQLQKRLNKTIIFVSHDLDEALKIGDRIAIMDDGRVLQCGTAHEIILHPANDMIENFVRHINPLNFLTARHIMQPFDEHKIDPPHSIIAKPETSLRDLINNLDSHKDPIGVSENGKIIGIVKQQDVIHHLAQHQKR